MSESGKSCCSLPEKGVEPASVCVNPESREPDGTLPNTGYVSRVVPRIDFANAGSTEGMIKLKGGTFLMGTTDRDQWISDGEGPVRAVTISPFYIDAHSVTNTQFAEFVAATGYVTEAEKFGWSFVFVGQLSSDDREKFSRQRVNGTEWWFGIGGTDWRHPYGPKSNLAGLEDHPVTQVSWNDAMAYCAWAGKRLPTEAEFEYAARGGRVQNRFCWGSELTPGGKHMCNIFQGTFPYHNTAEDGFMWTSPVGSFPPNDYGISDMAGNVWEWCGDWFDPRWHIHYPEAAADHPRGPALAQSKTMRGGSFLCHYTYCNRYRVGARTKNTPDSGAANIGFRCVRDL